MMAAPTRCSVRRDAGRTHADDRFGEGAYCCVFFARGCCSNGAGCTFLHRIPNEGDDRRLDTIRDVFGRERHNTNRCKKNSYYMCHATDASSRLR